MNEKPTLLHIMPEPRPEWPLSYISKIAIEDEIGRFLRTHRNGDFVLRALLESLPPDRTESEFQAECAERRAQHEAYVQKVLDENNEHRARIGLPPITRKDLK